MILPENFRPSRNPQSLLKEVDAAIRIKDIERLYRFRQQLEPKWWESGVTALLFISGLGFIITIYKLIPAENALLFWFIFFWFALFVLSLIAVLESLVSRQQALRGLFEIHTRLLEEHEKRLESARQNPEPPLV